MGEVRSYAEVRFHSSSTQIGEGIAGPYEDVMGKLDVWRGGAGRLGAERRKGDGRVERVQVFLRRVSCPYDK